MEKISIICPCCEAKINIDGQTGAILSHEEKKKVLGSFEDLLSQQDKQKELREQLFFAGTSRAERPQPNFGREI